MRTESPYKILPVLLAILTFGFALDATADSMRNDPQPGNHPNRLGWDSPHNVRSAARALRHGNKPLAVSHVKIALQRRMRRQVDLRFSLYVACVVQAEVGKATEAMPYCDRALKELPGQRGEFLNNRANALIRTGETEEAIRDYQAALVFFEAQKDEDIDKTPSVHANLAATRRNLAMATGELEASAGSVAADTKASISPESIGQEPASSPSPDSSALADSTDHDSAFDDTPPASPDL